MEITNTQNFGKLQFLIALIRADERVCTSIERMPHRYSDDELLKMYEGLIKFEDGADLTESIEKAEELIESIAQEIDVYNRFEDIKTENVINMDMARKYGLNNTLGICMEFERTSVLIEKEYKFTEQEIEDCKIVFASYNVDVEDCKDEHEIRKKIGEMFGLQ